MEEENISEEFKLKKKIKSAIGLNICVITPAIKRYKSKKKKKHDKIV